MEPVNINTSSPLELRTNSIGYLNEIRKWTMFFAVIGFIFILLLLVIGLAAGTFLSLAGLPMGGKMGMGIAFGFFYLLIAVIMFFPMLYLFRFSRMTKKAIHEADSEKIESGFLNLKKYFRFTGILTIIILSFYLIIFIAIMLGGFAGMFFQSHAM